MLRSLFTRATIVLPNPTRSRPDFELWVPTCEPVVGVHFSGSSLVDDVRHHRAAQPFTHHRVRVPGFGCAWVSGLWSVGCGVCGVWCGVWGLGFEVLGFGVGV